MYAQQNVILHAMTVIFGPQMNLLQWSRILMLAIDNDEPQTECKILKCKRKEFRTYVCTTYIAHTHLGYPCNSQTNIVYANTIKQEPAVIHAINMHTSKRDTFTISSSFAVVILKLSGRMKVVRGSRKMGARTRKSDDCDQKWLKRWILHHHSSHITWNESKRTIEYSLQPKQGRNL